ncbi:hypothetical protein OF83DRAFT_1146387, partial [Amylostereum chailletii]
MGSANQNSASCLCSSPSSISSLTVTQVLMDPALQNQIMNYLPAELQLDILERVCPYPQPIDMIPSAVDTHICLGYSTDWRATLIPEIRKSLVARRVLCLVSRSFNDLATPLLYAHLYINPSTTPRILATLDAQKLSMVHLLFMDFLPNFHIHLNATLAPLFACLTNVRTLFIRATTGSFGVPVQPCIDTPLANAMGAAPGQTLRQFAIVGDPLSLFTPTTLDTFASSLTRLTVLAVPSTSYDPRSPTLPVSFLRPTLVHLLPHLFRSASIFNAPPKMPHLVSLSLAGSLADLTRFLSRFALPALAELTRFLSRFALPALAELTFTTVKTDSGTMEALSDAVAALPALNIVWFAYGIAIAPLVDAHLAMWEGRGFAVMDQATTRVGIRLERSMCRQMDGRRRVTA